MFGEPKHGDKYFDITQKFKLNTSRLAAYKAYNATGELQRLTDKATFDLDAKNILNKYNRWQAAEYNAAVARSRTAKQFMDFQEDADLYPNMEWIMTRSADPREEHLVFVGTILPMDDPFWNENQPGNLWGCKCDWQPTDKEPTGTPDKTVTPAKGLDGNPVDGELFTDEHPYFTKPDKNASKEIDSFAFDNVLRPVLSEFKKTIDLFKGVEIISDNIATGRMIVLRRSVDDIINHTENFKVRASILNVENKAKNWDYIGYKKVDKFPKNHPKAGKSRHPESAYFFYYEAEIAGKIKIINVKIHKNFESEVLYAITDKRNGIKSGMPKDIERYIKKRGLEKAPHD